MNGQLIAAVVQAVANVVLVIVTWIYVRHTRSMVEAGERSVRTQTLLNLVQFLQDRYRRKARSYIRSHSADQVDFNDARIRSYCGTVCAAYDTIGLFVKLNLVESAPFTENYAEGIMDCHEKLTPFIEYTRQGDTQDRWLWRDFDWLNDQCKARLHKRGGATGTERQDRFTPDEAA